MLCVTPFKTDFHLLLSIRLPTCSVPNFQIPTIQIQYWKELYQFQRIIVRWICSTSCCSLFTSRPLICVSMITPRHWLHHKEGIIHCIHEINISNGKHSNVFFSVIFTFVICMRLRHSLKNSYPVKNYWQLNGAYVHFMKTKRYLKDLHSHTTGIGNDVDGHSGWVSRYNVTEFCSH